MRSGHFQSVVFKVGVVTTSAGGGTDVGSPPKNIKNTCYFVGQYTQVLEEDYSVMGEGFLKM